MNIRNPPFLLHEKLKEQSEKSPKKVIVEYYSDGNYKPYRYKDIYQLVLSFAHLLEKEAGHIAIISENRPEWICAYFAVLSVGLTNVPVDPQLTDPEIISILNDAEVKTLFTSIKYYDRLEDIKKSVPLLMRIIIVDEITGEQQKKTVSLNPDIDTIASLLYTSGTTAIPKGVELTHRNLSSNCNSIEEVGIVTSNDVILAILPFHHSYPFMATVLYPIIFGIKTIIANTFKGEELLQIMTEKGATMLVGVPQLFKVMNDNINSELKRVPYIIRTLGIYLIRRKLRKKVGKRFRFFLSGGAKLDEKVARNLFYLGLPILEGYGLTETSPVVTMNPIRKPRIGSAGKALPGVEIKIENPGTDGIGEILIKGQNVMKGYYKMSVETDEAIKDGWFHSGDLGFIDKDGYLYITGRLKEVIVLSSGKNIYPEELESFYSQIPFVKEICIIGRPQKEKPDISSGLWAIVFPDLEYFKKTGDVNIQRTLDWAFRVAVEKQPPYRRISGFTIAREELPRTRLGKIKRYEVESRYREVVIKQMVTTEAPIPLSPEDEKLLESPLGKEVTNLITKRLKLKRKLSINDHFELDLGIDSLGRIELLVGLEAILRTKIPDRVVVESYTVKDLIMKIQDYIRTPTKEEIAPEIADWGMVIKEAPSQDIVRKIELKPNWRSHIFVFIITKTLLLLYKTIWSLRIYGKENIPKTGPCIICSNHQSYMDGPLIASTIPFVTEMNLHFLGYRYYFEMPVLKRLVRLFRIIPIDTATNLVDSLRASVFILGKGKSLCIFPEGARTPDGNIQEFRKGIGILAKYAKVPIVPVYIDGSHKAWPITRTFPRPYPITIRYGKPVKIEELLIKSGAGYDYTAISTGLREVIQKLGSI